MANVDVERIRRELEVRLPLKARWLLHGVPLAFDFSRARSPLRPLGPSDVVGCDLEREWRTLWVFGEQDFADGGGACPYICVHGDNGRIYGLDVERSSDHMFLFNFNADGFVRTFTVLDGALRREEREGLTGTGSRSKSQGSTQLAFRRATGSA
jgi:hypothetical protein